VYDAIFAEGMNKPTVVLVNQDFFTDFESASSSRGVPIRGVSETVPPECTAMDKIKTGVNAAMDDILVALTKPLTGEEKLPRPKEVEKVQRVIFKGTLSEVNGFFYKRGWSDGLPIIPPTQEEVAEMLTGTDLAADHVVAKIIPRLGKATVEKIAINAVMAGALPTYMPILIAGVQALVEPNIRFGTTGVSTGSWIPFWILNGPVRRYIHINHGSGTLSPGNIANAVIGRAMGLIIKNIGGIRKGVEDMGIYGNPGKYSMVSGENEEESPWEPLHVEHGFKREDSAVTLCFPRSILQVPTFGSDAASILRSITSTLTTKAGAITIMMNVQHAKAFAEGGWTKKEIALFIYKYAQQPAYRTQDFWGQWGPERIRPPLNQTDFVAVLNGPDMVRVLVAGGPGALCTNLLTGGTAWETKKIELPANWDKLAAKYKGMVPTYYKY
jgi:hypothetical protein